MIPCRWLGDFFFAEPVATRFKGEASGVTGRAGYAGAGAIAVCPLAYWLVAA